MVALVNRIGNADLSVTLTESAKLILTLRQRSFWPLIWFGHNCGIMLSVDFENYSYDGRRPKWFAFCPDLRCRGMII